ncbi:MAG: DNA polymerase alpha catalytic subunit, partial [Paramarteilia canceri]
NNKGYESILDEMLCDLKNNSDKNESSSDSKIESDTSGSDDLICAINNNSFKQNVKEVNEDIEDEPKISKIESFLNKKEIFTEDIPVNCPRPIDSYTKTMNNNIKPSKTEKYAKNSQIFNKSKTIDIFLTDITDEFYHVNGNIYLFGKSYNNDGCSQSLCITVTKYKKTCYVKPKLEYSDRLDEVFAEIKTQFDTLFNIKLITYKSVKKTAVFEGKRDPYILIELKYLDFKSQNISKMLNGNTFDTIYGANDPIIEQFIVNNHLKLPQWVRLSNFLESSENSCWCDFQIEISNNDLDHSFEPIDAQKAPKVHPGLSAMTLSLIKSYDPASKTIQIIGYCSSFNQNYNLFNYKPSLDHFSSPVICICPPESQNFPYDFKTLISQKKDDFKVEFLPNERAVLGSLLSKMQRYDPDVLLTFDFAKYDAALILSRIENTKTPFFSKIGRLKLAKNNFRSTKNYSISLVSKIFIGRLVADCHIFSQELLNLPSYSLTDVLSHFDDKIENYQEYTPNRIFDMYSSSQMLEKVLYSQIIRNNSILKIVDKLLFIPLAAKLSNICGITPSKIFMGGRSERTEYLLLHAFKEQSLLPPEKNTKFFKDSNNQTNVKSKSKYQGGLVLNPKIGLYDEIVLVLDYNSLYPSIIQEFNICFSTVLPGLADLNLCDSTSTEWINKITELIANKTPKEAVLPSKIRYLVEARKEIKSRMNNSQCETEKQRLNIEQQAYKITANSMYGCLGFQNSRFYAQHLAEMITFKGREALLAAKLQAEKVPKFK